MAFSRDLAIPHLGLSHFALGIIRAVVGFKKVIRPLYTVGVHRVPTARGGGGRGREGDLPQENFVIQDD